MVKLLISTCLLGLAASAQTNTAAPTRGGNHAESRQLGFFHNLDVDAHNAVHDIGHDVKNAAIGAAHLAKATVLAPVHAAEAAGDLVTGPGA